MNVIWKTKTIKFYPRNRYMYVLFEAEIFQRNWYIKFFFPRIIIKYVDKLPQLHRGIVCGLCII